MVGRLNDCRSWPNASWKYMILSMICCGLPTSTGPPAIASSMSRKVISLPGVWLPGRLKNATICS